LKQKDPRGRLRGNGVRGGDSGGRARIPFSEEVLASTPETQEKREKKARPVPSKRTQEGGGFSPSGRRTAYATDKKERRRLPSNSGIKKKEGSSSRQTKNVASLSCTRKGEGKKKKNAHPSTNGKDMARQPTCTRRGKKRKHPSIRGKSRERKKYLCCVACHLNGKARERGKTKKKRGERNQTQT